MASIFLINGLLEGSQSHISHSLTFKCITKMLQWDFQLLHFCYYHTELLSTKRSSEIPEAIFSPGHQAKNNLFSSLGSQMYKDTKTGRRSVALLAKILIFFLLCKVTTLSYYLILNWLQIYSDILFETISELYVCARCYYKESFCILLIHLKPFSGLKILMEALLLFQHLPEQN